MLDKDKEYFLSEYQKKLNTLSGYERARYKGQMYAAAYGMNMPMSAMVQMATDTPIGLHRAPESNRKLLLL